MQEKRVVVETKTQELFNFNTFLVNSSNGNYDEKLNNSIMFNQSQISEISFWNQAYYVFFDVYNVFLNRINNATLSDTERKKLVHSFADFISYCNFNGKSCQVSDFV